MMEWWKNGILDVKMEIILILIFDLEIVFQKDFILKNPLFQHSSIPSPHGICLRHSQLPLTWPRGPGFLCLNNSTITGDTTVAG
jgi:hypothetical protein